MFDHQHIIPIWYTANMLTTFHASVLEIEQLTEKVYRFVFKLKNPTQLEFSPGQYILLNIPGGFRQYSISSAPYENKIVETVVDVTPMGAGSRYLLSLKKNDGVVFRAPLGVFVSKDTPSPKIFLATGTGITPFKSMIQSLVKNKFSAPIFLFWGVRTKKDIYFDSLFKEIAKKNSFFTYAYCLSQERIREECILPGRITSVIPTQYKLNDFPPSAEWYVCGRPQMIDDMLILLKEDLKIDPIHIFHEKFT